MFSGFDPGVLDFVLFLFERGGRGDPARTAAPLRANMTKKMVQIKDYTLFSVLTASWYAILRSSTLSGFTKL